MIDKIYKYLEYLKTKNEILVFLKLFENGVMAETLLCKEFKMHSLKVKKIARSLSEQGLVVAQVDTAGEVYYAVTNKTYDFVGECSLCKKKECKRMQIESTGEKFMYYKCMNGKCRYHTYFNNKIKVILVKKITKPCNIVVYSQNKSDGSGKWTLNDFCKYVKTKYEKSFPGVQFKYHANFKRVISEFLVLVKGMVNGVDYKERAVECIDEIFSKFITNEQFNLKDFTNFNTLKDIVGAEDRPKKRVKPSTEMCKVYEIRCSYCSGGDCELTKSDIPCTKTIRQSMLRKYNATSIFDIKGQA